MHNLATVRAATQEGETPVPLMHAVRTEIRSLGGRADGTCMVTEQVRSNSIRTLLPCSPYLIAELQMPMLPAAAQRLLLAEPS